MMKRAVQMLKRFLTNPKIRFDYLTKLGLFNKWSDEKFLEKKYYLTTGKKLDLIHPKSFNEKLQWLKIYDRKPIYTMMVDKYAVKEFVAECIGEEHVIPTLGVWERFNDIDFTALPDQFVLKCTHDSKGVVIVRNKAEMDKKAAEKKLEASLKRNYYYMGREWPYKNVSPRIIAEKYMMNEGREYLTDYKFMCFSGKVKCSFTVTERFSKEGMKVTFFDREWNEMPFERHYPKSEKKIAKPLQYEKMCELAERLSQGIPFVRVDLYEVNGQVYFGEMTFYPGEGMEEFTPKSWDDKLGSWINLLDVKL